MKKKYYLSLLIFCAILSQEIVALSEKNIEKSSDVHIRQKRLINHSPTGDQSAHASLSRHLVQVLVAGNFECAGNILEADIILTSRNCLYARNDMYTVLSGSRTRNNGTSHRVVISVKHDFSNLALLKIYPPINLNPLGNIKIRLFEGHLPPNSYGLFTGWGCTDITAQGTRIYPDTLNAALLPIIATDVCARALRATHQQIPHRSVVIICTLDQHREKSACNGDEGGSLVYGGRLLGIYSHNGGVNLGVHPDVFMSLGDERIFRWISHYTSEFHRPRRSRVVHAG